MQYPASDYCIAKNISRFPNSYKNDKGIFGNAKKTRNKKNQIERLKRNGELLNFSFRNPVV